MIVRIHRQGRVRYLLVTKARTYEHDSLASAKKQEAAINISKARAAGHRIPRRT